MRFSYLSTNGFAKSVPDVDARRAVLYDPARLERRFRFFESVALPTLARQDDRDFTCAVLIGSCFPDRWRARLEDLVSNVAMIQIVTLPPMVHIQAVKAAYDALPQQDAVTHVATFRQDDDDGLHKTTVSRIRAIADNALQMWQGRAPFVIAFNRGFYLDPTEDPPFSEWYERAPIGIGLALVAPKGDGATVFRRNHRNLVEYYDCYSEVAQPMWIRSVHQDNDSAAMPQGRPGTLKARGIARTLKEGFGLTTDCLKDLA